MKFCRFLLDGNARYGRIESVAGNETITAVADSLPQSPSVFERAPKIDLALKDAALIAPLQPTKIVCVGRNYREHAAELGNEVPAEPLIFLKPPSSLLDPGGAIVRPRISTRVDHEGELGVVIRSKCYKLRDGEDVRSFILGYTCVNDVTARDLQKKDGQWTRGKGFDTFCPVGPVVSDEVDPWSGLQVQTRVNGVVRQDGNTRDVIFSLDEVIRYISSFMTLNPGDLIATGTPAGVGPLNTGDIVEVSVAGLCALRNPVVDEAPSSS